MDVMEEAVRMGEKVCDMFFMEHARRLGENGHARWQMKPLCDAAQSGAIAWVREGYLKELRNQGSRLQRRQDLPLQYFVTAEEVRKQALFNVTYRWLSHGIQTLMVFIWLASSTCSPMGRQMTTGCSSTFQTCINVRELSRQRGTMGGRSFAFQLSGASFCQSYPKGSTVFLFGSAGGAMWNSSCRHCAN